MTAHLNAAEAAHEKAVKAMFAGIAGRYDLLNHVMSMNIDRLWRRKVRRELQPILDDESAVVLDVACGTGDLSIELSHGSKARVIGTDFCRPMLAVADEKVGGASLGIPLLEADAMSLPFNDDCFDAVTIAFGLRNLPNHADGLSELLRILKPGGKLVVLECSNPALPGFRQAFDLYFNKIVPRIGGLISGSRGAYTYLPQSVSRFPDKKRLASMMTEAGFAEVKFTSLTGGVAAIHVGVKA